MTTDLINNRTAERHDFLWGVFVTALEGGVNYWARVGRYRPGWYEGTNERELEDYRNFHALVRCDEDDSGEVHRIDVNTIARGIGLIKKNKIKINSTIRDWIVVDDNDNEGSNIDADAADCIVQAGLFGEIIYG